MSASSRILAVTLATAAATTGVQAQTAVQPGFLYLTDTCAGRVATFNKKGNLLQVFDQKKPTPGLFPVIVNFMSQTPGEKLTLCANKEQIKNFADAQTKSFKASQPAREKQYRQLLQKDAQKILKALPPAQESGRESHTSAGSRIQGQRLS